MRKDVRDIVISLSVAVIAFIGILLAPGSFLIHPSFDNISISQSSELQKVITITNNGWVQAKDVRININSNGVLNLTNNDCPEGFDVIDKKNHSQLLVHLDRMSTNLPCDLTVDLGKGTQLGTVVVTADNSPAYQRQQDQNITEQLFIYTQNMVTVITIVAVLAVITRIILYIKSS